MRWVILTWLASIGLARADAPKWGAPIPAPRVERQVVQLLHHLQGGGRAAVGALSEPVFLGPGLWAVLAGDDAALAKLGTDMQVVDPKHMDVKLSGRMFLEADARNQLVASGSVRGWLGQFATGKPRTATEAERAFLYALVPFEIAGEPVTVVELGKVSLLVLVHADRIMWIDLPQAYCAPFKVCVGR